MGTIKKHIIERIFYNEILSEEKTGVEITIDNDNTLFFVSESEDIICYAGVFFNNDIKPILNMGISRGLTKNDLEYDYRLIRIERGCILFDNFLNNESYKKTKYKKMGCKLDLPVGATTYFGVMNRIEQNESWRFEENKRMTLEVFGICYDELDALLLAYSKVLCTFTEYVHYPRLTRSNQKDNVCELTGLWIPRYFPYISFCSNDYDFSHISLWGFYRHLGLLTGGSENSAFFKTLCKNGAAEKSLKEIISYGDYFWPAKKVMYSDIYKH